MGSRLEQPYARDTGCACREGCRNLFKCDAADGEHRNLYSGSNSSKGLETNRALARTFENGSEQNEVGGRMLRGNCFFKRMHGYAQVFHQRTYTARGQTIGRKVYAVNSRCKYDIEPIVDEDACTCTQR